MLGSLGKNPSDNCFEILNNFFPFEPVALKHSLSYHFSSCFYICNKYIQAWLSLKHWFYVIVNNLYLWNIHFFLYSQELAVMHVWKVTSLGSVTSAWFAMIMICVRVALRQERLLPVILQITLFNAFWLELISVSFLIFLDDILLSTI